MNIITRFLYLCGARKASRDLTDLTKTEINWLYQIVNWNSNSYTIEEHTSDTLILKSDGSSNIHKIERNETFCVFLKKPHYDKFVKRTVTVQRKVRRYLKSRGLKNKKT